MQTPTTPTFRDAMNITHVLCAWPECTTVLGADDAIWDDTFDLAYCSKFHLVNAQENRLVRRWDFEDRIFNIKTT